MNDDLELEKILSSIKKDREKLNELLSSQEPPTVQVDPVSNDEIIEDCNQQEEPKKDVKANINERLLALLTIFRRTFITKQFGIIGLIILVIAVSTAAGVKVYNYNKTGYLNPYIEKYKIEYPEGILKQFCEQYGKRQTTVGALAIKDADTNVYVTSEKTVGYAYAPDGTDVYHNQQFRAIDLNGLSDIESIYSTKEGFLSASQIITFNTLFEKKQYQVIGAYYTNKNANDDNGYIFPYNIYGNLTEKSFTHFTDSIMHRSLYDTGYNMTYNHNYVSLYCDSDYMPDFVFVIVCVEIDKKFEKITTAQDKEKIHYPQIWYDKADEKNPYFLSGKWYPEIYTNVVSQKTKKLTARDFRFD